MADEEIASPELDNLADFLANLMANCVVSEDGDVYETKALVEKRGELSIHIYPREHAPPHFHVKSSDKEASYSIDSCELLNGTLGSRGDKIVKYFHKQRKDKLIEIWNKTRPGDCAVGMTGMSGRS